MLFTKKKKREKQRYSIVHTLRERNSNESIFKKMIDWPAELGSSGSTTVNSIATTDNIPTRTELVSIAAEVKFYPYSNTTFSGIFCPIVSISILLDCGKSIKNFTITKT